MTSSTSFDFTPVVILGAARSGTNMLRDVLCRLPGAATWPCDEINPIWRHGNLRHPDDAFPAAFARPEVRAFIRGRFARQARRTGASWLVEKTCANTLRVGFVDAVLPEARYLHISREGLDAVGSAMKRWGADLNLGYTLRKARYVPPSDLPHYLGGFLANRLSRAFSGGGERRLRTWGPRFPGMEEVARERPLAELCAHQWRACEEHTHEQLAAVPAARRHALRYEEVVADPEAALAGIRAFLGADWSAEAMQAAVAGVRRDSVGKGKTAFSDEEVAALERILEPEAAGAQG
jgi:hypothetical protein